VKAFLEWGPITVAILGLEAAVSLKWFKLGPRLLLITSMTLNMRSQLVLKSMNLDDIERPLLILKYCLLHVSHSQGRHRINLNVDILLATYMQPTDSRF